MGKTFIAIIIAALAIAGGYFLLNKKALAPEDGASLRMPAPGFQDVLEMIVSPDAGTAHAVSYTAGGFSPKTITITRGEAVTFINEGGPSMWVASALHPTHSVYDGTTLDEHCNGAGAVSGAFDQCGAGVEFSFAFEKSGTWKYHNHMFTNDTGTVIVQ